MSGSSGSSNTYGPRYEVKDGRVVPNFIFQAFKCQDSQVYGDGTKAVAFVTWMI